MPAFLVSSSSRRWYQPPTPEEPPATIEVGSFCRATSRTFRSLTGDDLVTVTVPTSEPSIDTQRMVSNHAGYLSWRSEERREGNECVSKRSVRRSLYKYKKTN